jgi:hypothetical protein
MASPESKPSGDAAASLSAYVRRKQISLAHDIRGRRKVYLDTKYWALLRDARLGRSKCPDTIRLLRALEARVLKGTALCPFNADIYLEVIKQSDEHTLLATATLIDDLSLGVCMVPIAQRQQLELLHFIESCRWPAEAIHDPSDLVWTKSAYAMGFCTPTIHSIPPDTNETIQKLFADYMWTVGVVDMLKSTRGVKAAATNSSANEMSCMLNEGKAAHVADHDSFRSVFLSEMWGALDAYRDIVPALLRYIYNRDTGGIVSEAESENTEVSQGLVELMYDAFRTGKLKKRLPTVRISAGLHAAIRWDRGRKYKPNDSLDVRHAAAALPYCSLFFTERSLCHLLRSGHLNFQKEFECRAAHTPADAVSLLEQRT